MFIANAQNRQISFRKILSNIATAVLNATHCLKSEEIIFILIENSITLHI